MFIVLSLAAIVALVMFLGPSNHSNAPQQDTVAGGPMPPAHQAPSPSLNFFQPQMPNGPILSPDKRYLWDPYRQTWIRHYTAGDLMMNLILGFAAAVGLLYYLGFIQ